MLIEYIVFFWSESQLCCVCKCVIPSKVFPFEIVLYEIFNRSNINSLCRSKTLFSSPRFHIELYLQSVQACLLCFVPGIMFLDVVSGPLFVRWVILGVVLVLSLFRQFQHIYNQLIEWTVDRSRVRDQVHRSGTEITVWRRTCLFLVIKKVYPKTTLVKFWPLITVWHHYDIWK